MRNTDDQKRYLRYADTNYEPGQDKDRHESLKLSFIYWYNMVNAAKYISNCSIFIIYYLYTI